MWIIRRAFRAHSATKRCRAVDGFCFSVGGDVERKKKSDPPPSPEFCVCKKNLLLLLCVWSIGRNFTEQSAVVRSRVVWMGAMLKEAEVWIGVRMAENQSTVDGGKAERGRRFDCGEKGREPEYHRVQQDDDELLSCQV